MEGRKEPTARSMRFLRHFCLKKRMDKADPVPLSPPRLGGGLGWGSTFQEPTTTLRDRTLSQAPPRGLQATWKIYGAKQRFAKLRKLPPLRRGVASKKSVTAHLMRLFKHFRLKNRVNTAVLASILFLLPLSGRADTDADIEQLIQRVAVMKDARFIRNGSEYSAANAAEFMRKKWQAQCKDMQSVQEFIDTCVSKSSMSGKPYQIRQAGKTLPAAEVLSALAKQ
jgi:Family of unknown function (DUF5329)